MWQAREVDIVAGRRDGHVAVLRGRPCALPCSELGRMCGVYSMLRLCFAFDKER